MLRPVQIGLELGLEEGSLIKAQAQLVASASNKEIRAAHFDSWIAQLLVDPVRNPPKILHGIVRLQSVGRQWLFRRHAKQFGWSNEMLPVDAEVAVALFLSRRMRNPAWVDFSKEALEIAHLYCGKRNLTDVAFLADLITRYESALEDSHPALSMLKEKQHMMLVVFQESLQAELERVGEHPSQLSQVVTGYKNLLPSSLQYAVEFAQIEYDRVCTTLEKAFNERLPYCSRIPDLINLEKEIIASFGELNTMVLPAVRRAKLQRTLFLEYEIRNRWEWPLNGSLPSLKVAARAYVAELGVNHPLVEEFIRGCRSLMTEQRALLAKQAAKDLTKILSFKRQIASSRARVLQEQLQLELDEVTNLAKKSLLEFSRKLGADEVVETGRTLLSPRSFSSLSESLVELTVDRNEDAEMILGKMAKVIGEGSMKGRPFASDKELVVDENLFSVHDPLLVEIKEDEVVQGTLPDAEIIRAEFSEAPNTKDDFVESISSPMSLVQVGVEYTRSGMYKSMYSYQECEAPTMLTQEGQKDPLAIKVSMRSHMSSEDQSLMLDALMRSVGAQPDALVSVGMKGTDWFVEICESNEQLYREIVNQSKTVEPLKSNILQISKLTAQDLWAYDILKNPPKPQHIKRLELPELPKTHDNRKFYVPVDNTKRNSAVALEHPLYKLYDNKQADTKPQTRFFLTRGSSNINI